MTEEIANLGIELPDGAAGQIAEYVAAKISAVQRESLIERLLNKHGARNVAAAAALLTGVTAATTAEDAEKAVVALKNNAETSFLFEKKVLDLKGITPAGAGTEELDKNSLSYAQLAKLYR